MPRFQRAQPVHAGHVVGRRRAAVRPHRPAARGDHDREHDRPAAEDPRRHRTAEQRDEGHRGQHIAAGWWWPRTRTAHARGRRSAPGAVSAAATPGLGALRACGRSRGGGVHRVRRRRRRRPQRCDVVRHAARPGLACDIWLTASTACVRELTPSARSTAATWSFTVSTDSDSSRAISLFGHALEQQRQHLGLARRQAERLEAAHLLRRLGRGQRLFGHAAHHRRHGVAAAGSGAGRPSIIGGM